jgi:glycosyltransferase involved in cell wall biosynthesis
MSRVTLPGRTVWSSESFRRTRRALREEKSHVLHVQNFFPLLSPSIYYAARAEGVPVVQTLHNYRILCPSALFFRDGHLCEDCLGRRLPWPGVLHKCYRQSRSASAVVAGMLAAHNALGTWDRAVDIYVALTQFGRRKFIEGGLPAERIVVKPNFVHPDPGPGEGNGDYALFVGRLSPEKGISTLLTAWKQLKGPIRLVIVGDGPSSPEVLEASQRTRSIEWLGRRSGSEVYDLMGRALCLVLPSEWYEGFPRVAVEAFAKGIPIVASRVGALPDIIADNLTGLHFVGGNAEDLAAKLEWAFGHPELMRAFGRQGREEYELRFTADQNYQQLVAIYHQAMTAAQERR